MTASARAARRRSSRQRFGRRAIGFAAGDLITDGEDVLVVRQGGVAAYLDGGGAELDLREADLGAWCPVDPSIVIARTRPDCD